MNEPLCEANAYRKAQTYQSLLKYAADLLQQAEDGYANGLWMQEVHYFLNTYKETIEE